MTTPTLHDAMVLMVDPKVFIKVSKQDMLFQRLGYMAIVVD